jgi:hypothetical protein
MREWPQFERRHRRAALLAAYRRRHRWKAADLRPLLRLGVSVAAQHRMVHILSKGGAGVVRPYEPLLDSCARASRLLADIFAPGTSRGVRQRLLASTPWWPPLIEAAYRGELAVAQRVARRQEYGHEEPSEIAYREVAEAAGLSTHQVHRLCQQARASYAGGDTPRAAMCAAVLREFINTGHLPEP